MGERAEMMAAYRLYWSERTGAFAPAAVMAELELPCEAVRIEKAAREEAAYRALNPMGQIPTLVLPDGRVMSESAAIVLYMAQQVPDSGLVPKASEAIHPLFLRWLFFCQCNLYETVLRFAYPARYTDGDDVAAVADVRSAAAARMDALWDIVAAAIGDGSDSGPPYFFAARFTVLDIYIAMLSAWHPDPPALLRRLPVLARLVGATVARPAIAPLWRTYHMHAGPA
ncbi:MAG: glutathione S-transferase family protein [Alphaproteobacteria bacterium]|nr:MAG: glutathione S-transferase family protein [Alphaproteobacteria bacterium]